ncbi:unnamed protein product [Miscanthus lutarioriparius]|uniref:Uncharacterized protein n=1 Tax=Miscanthus lutarioriparius TaxID=422564 RepID=A0A811PBM7_9POAL|nr:unnamed protein product [Miscanthus lutarioriparius]
MATDASAVSNRPEGLALLTTIAEGTGCCNPSPPLPNHSALEKSLTSKILRLREVLDLPCQSSCDVLDQLLLDTLGVLKIAYPKCLSGLSGNHTSSVREGLVHLHRVLMLVQDCHSKNKQFPSSGSEKQTIIGSESLDHVGERVIEMIDQVTPVVKEMFSFMESSSSATAASASSAWPEDLPERRSLPPVLCRTRSPAHRGSASHRPSDGDEVAMPRQDGTARHTGHCKVRTPAPGLEEDGQTSSSRHEPPSTPSPTVDPLPLQSTLSSVSPHLLSAPPPSPMPVVDLLACPCFCNPGRQCKMATPPQQLCSLQSSHSLLRQRRRRHRETPRPSAPAWKALRALHHLKLMGSLYRRLRDRVEGSGSTHGGKRRQNGKRLRTACAPKSDAGGQNMADALAEMTKRSAYFRQIEEDAEKHAAAILEVKDAIGSFQSKDMAELVRFHQHVEQQLVSLTDETQVLARFEGFPSKKLEALRTAAALYSKLDGAASRLKCWKLTAGPVSPQLDRVESYFNKVKDDVDMVERNREEETRRLQSHGVHFDFSVLVRIKEGMVDLSSACMELALKESQDARETTTTTTTRAQWASSHGDRASRMLWRVFQLAFRVYSFAGGQDERADRLTSILAHEIEARRL